ncbi:5-(carboxyamino)imidazole ribonucleotide mutase [Deferrisoma camini]|uniref:5-(carboxyamino)imidazole ribonucleotide mutase n=1 Tax=Deferrisoma camini TaxID=1035120 RepID=UPI00046CEF11|nr:5-(carboxyamino)imidazole ribonucleotide mutase [Deferrisoma camini]
MSAKPKVLILMGSDSDLPVVQEAAKFLDRMQVPYAMRVSSAHRSPERTRRLVAEAEAQGVEVFVCAAGMAAHLAGVVAAETVRPVIGIPVDAGALRGMDALLSTVQMPPGIPVATVAIGKAGARNAAVLACQILALADPDLALRLRSLREAMAREVEEKDARIGGGEG